MVEEIAQVDDHVQLVRAPVVFGRPGLALLRDLFRLRKQIRELNLDAVLYHLYATALAIRLATLGLPLRRVHMVAGPLYLESRLIRTVERLLARLDSVTICGSRFTLDRYRALGIPEKQLRYVPYGVDLNDFRPPTAAEESTARTKLGYAAEDFVVVMVAYVYAPKRLVYSGRGIKGHEDLLEAWTAFAEERSDARLLLVGGGFDEAGERHRNALVSGIPGGLAQQRIEWLDSVDDVREAYAAADVSVSPSLSENHGAALEASAMGVPCIVSDAGALPEAVNSESGWVHRAGSPSSLLRALETAYAARSAPGFENYSEHARSTMEAEFSQSQSAKEAVDILVDTETSDESTVPSRAPITMFSEARFESDSSGAVYSTDSSLRGFEWQRALVGAPGIRLAARVDSRPVPSARYELSGDFAGLPFYQGLGHLVRRLPALLKSIDRVVRSSRAISVKLPGAIGLIAVYFAGRRNVPVAAEVVGDVEDVLKSGVAGLPGRIMAAPATFLTRWAVRRARAVRYVTRSTLQTRFPSRRDAVSVTYTDVFVNDNELGRALGTVEPGLVLAIGSQEQMYKGHDLLIRALEALLPRFPNAHLQLIGSGRMQAELRTLAADLGVAERVEFAGFIADRTELRQRLDSAEIFALPSRTEGLPRALIEAMSRGLPCVASRVGGTPELLSDEALCVPDDAHALTQLLDRFLSDQTLRERQSSRNLRVAAEYTQTGMRLAREAWREAVLSIASKRSPGDR